MSTVCLTMIVKNEAHVIRRCLASVLPFIDAWVIVDTGSTDGTQDIIREFLHELPGELLERPWVNFGHNRTEALALARLQSTADFLFTIDADEVLRLPPDFVRPALVGEAYMLDVISSGTHYGRTCLFNRYLPWRYVGVLHEYPTCDRPVSTPVLPGPWVVVFYDGGRSQQNVLQKYAADAELLEEALRQEPLNVRYVFYLAQSYRDSGQTEKALATYERRAAMGGWVEEVWFSLFSAARLAEKLGHSADEVTHRYLRAYDYRPQRVESLSELARYQRGLKQFAAARLFAERAMKTPLNEDVLFVDRSHAQWRAADEYAIASYWTGDYTESQQACEALLANPQLPAAQRPRIVDNLNFARTALATAPRG